MRQTPCPAPLTTGIVLAALIQALHVRAVVWLLNLQTKSLNLQTKSLNLQTKSLNLQTKSLNLQTKSLILQTIGTRPNGVDL
jgi:hypothetical protein